MATEAISVSSPVEETFQTGEVLSIAGGHLINDTYTAFLPTLLPLLIDKMSLSLVLAGSLTSIAQIPALLDPFIGYLADRLSLRYFVIFAPAVTATVYSSLGFAPSYLVLAVMLFVGGISTAAFHAPAPAMISRISGRQLGKGMSFFMAAGELGRTIGPLLFVWAVSTWTLDGYWRVMVFGWAASLVLYLKLRNIAARPARSSNLKNMLPAMRRLALPLSTVVFLKGFVVICLAIFLPTYLTQQGAPFWVTGAALALAQAAGVVGALASGPVSDRWGRRPVLLVSVSLSAVFMLFFLFVQSWVLVPVLLLLGLTSLSTQPVLLAIVQEQFTSHRAVANGLFMLFSFMVQSIGILLVGYIGDQYGLRTAYLWSALLSLLALPAILKLPERPQGNSQVIKTAE
jgi:MFS transporter, FSR family, fosmidomycin resistance protein